MYSFELEDRKLREKIPQKVANVFSFPNHFFYWKLKFFWPKKSSETPVLCISSFMFSKKLRKRSWDQIVTIEEKNRVPNPVTCSMWLTHNGSPCRCRGPLMNIPGFALVISPYIAYCILSITWCDKICNFTVLEWARIPSMFMRQGCLC